MKLQFQISVKATDIVDKEGVFKTVNFGKIGLQTSHYLAERISEYVTLIGKPYDENIDMAFSQYRRLENLINSGDFSLKDIIAENEPEPIVVSLTEIDTDTWMQVVKVTTDVSLSDN